MIRLPFIPYTSYRHEILHNWWGNGVYVDWEEGNWCEGLTSYGADHAAKEEQGFTEGRIAAIEQCLGEAEIIDVSLLDTGGRVVFGATLELYDMGADAEVKYQIVGEMEADISSGLISISSPIARALIGKHEGDEISFDAPGGAREYEIISVKYV